MLALLMGSCLNNFFFFLFLTSLREVKGTGKKACEDRGELNLLAVEDLPSQRNLGGKDKYSITILW